MIFTVLYVAFAVALILGMLAVLAVLLDKKPKHILIEYVNILHVHGINSKKAKAFLAEHEDDPDFVRRAASLHKLMGIADECVCKGCRRSKA